MFLNCYSFSCKTNLNRRYAVFFVVFSILWILSGCRVIRTADSTQGQDENWWRNSPRRKDFNWYSTTFKLKTIDQGNVHAKTDSQSQIKVDSNEGSFDLRTLPLQRYDWWWMTTSTTEAPYVIETIDMGSNIDGFLVCLIVFPLMAAAIYVCKYHLCEDRSCTDVLCRELCDVSPEVEQSISRRSQNSRSSRFTAFENYSFSTEENRSTSGGRSTSRPRISLALSQNEDRFLSSSVSGGSRTTQSTSRAIDKPPGYSDVVLADFSASLAQFPEVNPTIPDSPPPKYDEGNIKY